MTVGVGGLATIPVGASRMYDCGLPDSSGGSTI